MCHIVFCISLFVTRKLVLISRSGSQFINRNVFRIVLPTALWGDRQYHTARTYGVAAFIILLLALLIAPNDARQLEVVDCYEISRRAALNGGNKRYSCGNRREEQASLLTHNIKTLPSFGLSESQGQSRPNSRNTRGRARHP